MAIYTRNTHMHCIANHIAHAIDHVLEYLSIKILLHSNDIVILRLNTHPTCTIDALEGRLQKLYSKK